MKPQEMRPVPAPEVWAEQVAAVFAYEKTATEVARELDMVLPTVRNWLWEAARLRVWERCGGLCDRCGRGAVDAHHRRPRSSGGNRSAYIAYSPNNLAALCRDCHVWVEGNRRLARDTGWLVPGWCDPADVVAVDVGGNATTINDSEPARL